MIRWLKRGAFALLILIVLAFAAGWWLMHGSLATLDGDISLPGLSAPATIERDALGVVTIHAANEVDAMRALGYVHAQERFFEMDLARRSAAGELSELFGKIALDVDKQHRVHRFRARAIENILEIAGDKLPQLQAYTDGVNAGLADLRVRPWPYLLLQAKPEPWQLSDTALAGYAMFFDLQGGTNERELALWRIRQVVPAALYKLIAADGTEWDAPLEGAPRGNIALPDAATLDLRKLPAPGIDGSPPYVDPNAPGSNNFAVAGALTKDGRAIVANDMHLGLRAPNIWFRARLLYPDERAVDGKVDVSGFTLPGIPAVIVGSNTHVAWGFTNSYGDYMDWLRIRYFDKRSMYLSASSDPAQPIKPIDTYNEKIEVKGSEPVIFVVREADGNPVIYDERDGTSLALQWTAHMRDAISLELMHLGTARNIWDARGIAVNSGVPTQNFLVADQQGHVGWTLIGRLPLRACDATSPSEPNEEIGDVVRACKWVNLDHSLLPNQMPNLVEPSSSRLWTANNRVTDGTDLATIGDSGYALGARAKQIRDDLFANNQFTEKDLLAIQLDDRTLFLERWWKQLRALVQMSNDPELQRIEAATRHWDAHASADAVTYRIVRAWRLEVLDRIQQGLMAPAEVALGKQFVMPQLDQLEGVAWELVMQRPQNLLSRKYDSWNALLIDAAHAADSKLEKYGPLAQRQWGERNTAAICHPLAGALPSFLKGFLCMPADGLPGDSNMPRVAAPDFGASERMVVSPGHEADGIIEMPAGQSGNPLSPFWGAGHAAWVHGEATPFLPGPTTHTLRLVLAR